ncbi:citrate lyase subunit beta [Prescottella equi]|uniref:HpcH/HpaI aldolase/citrate lyase family protein n=1 Tax=Prescottella equi ATCC 33707 TaxID=525370 RepID=E9T7H8_RHOHA|nr:aldolase/citrate lyase family protein [Prescottella equi]EGD21678.1 HpcH/HpaI aldolase/citrate lyase family protein [Prescottella equi ATCC 33707]MBM4520414.1 citrate lyase subunit beta [Prescottella equi]MBM4531831.1 citrate lyase subunit beta [Prescottella equi]MBM4547574.1 citrate lyase subunit beta [Prescottella equi]MBM4569381.1 citrate lyase subunit beta [Prescottella equi]
MAVAPRDARSWLLVPGTRTHDLDDTIRRCGPDAVVLDLEDGVAPEDRARARDEVHAWASRGGRAWIRVNAATTADWSVDLEFAARCPGILGVVLAKAESAAQVDATAAALGDFGGGLIALIESATGILEAVSIARSNSLTRLAFGSGDFRHDTAATDDSATVMGARAHLVLASRSAGLPAPIDGPSLAPDVSGLRDYCRRSLTTGLGGMLCVKPDHVRTINTEFAPSPEQVRGARNLLEHRSGSIDGSYLPRLRAAEAVLERARTYRIDPADEAPVSMSR